MRTPAFLALALGLGMAIASPLAASAQPYGGGFHGGHRHVEGRIVSVQGSDFTLDNGRTIFLHRGTVINPTGRRIHRGEFVTVDGMSAGNHNVNANEVDIAPRR